MRLIFSVFVTFVYFHGLLYSSGAVNTTVPQTFLQVQMASIKSFEKGEESITVLRSLPHLRVVNTLHRYHHHETTIQTQNRKGDTNKPLPLESQKPPSALLRSKSNTTTDYRTPKVEVENIDSTKSESESYTLAPLLSLVAFALLWRLLLTILIYRESNQSFELYFNELGQIRRRRIFNRDWRSFLTIFRTLPIRMNQRSRSRSRTVLSGQAQFIALANRLNEQRVANGERPMNLESLALLFSSRDFSGVDYDSLWEVQEQNENTSFLRQGASDEEINRCPVRTLFAGDELISDDGQHDSDDGATLQAERTKCTICLENYQAGEMIRTLPCFHSFHVGCIDQWLHMKSLCPICKHNIIE